MFGLKDEQILAINQVFEKYPDVELVVIYGSRAKGTFKKASDIDLILLGNLSDKQLIKIENEIDDLLLPYKMDISLKIELNNTELLSQIENTGKIFYNKISRALLNEPEVEYKSILNKNSG